VSAHLSVEEAKGLAARMIKRIAGLDSPPTIAGELIKTAATLMQVLSPSTFVFCHWRPREKRRSNAFDTFTAATSAQMTRMSAAGIGSCRQVMDRTALCQAARRPTAACSGPPQQYRRVPSCNPFVVSHQHCLCGWGPVHGRGRHVPDAPRQLGTGWMHKWMRTRAPRAQTRPKNRCTHMLGFFGSFHFRSPTCSRRRRKAIDSFFPVF